MISRFLHIAAGLLVVFTLSAESSGPDAIIDLATGDGVKMVQGQWRYSDTKIVETAFHAPDKTGQPYGPTNTTYDFTPHAGGAAFDDSAWEAIAPTS